MNLNYKALGDIAQNCAIGEFSKFGIGVGIVLSDNFSFDLIVIVNNQLYKVQTKGSSQLYDGSIKFGLTTNNFYSGEKRTYTKKDCDIIACYDLLNHKMFLLEEKDFVERSSISIRYDPPKNNQTINHWDKDLIISEQRLKVLFDYKAPDFGQVYSDCRKNAKIYLHKCQSCGKDYENGFKSSKFCSYKCNGASQRKAQRPSKEELSKLLESNSYLAVGKMYGVSDNSIRKWML